MNEIRQARPLLGTFVDIYLRGEYDTAILLSCTTRAFEAIRQVQLLMSMFESDSELNRLNRLANTEPVCVHEWTWEVLKAARQFHRDSEGSFDPAIGSAMIEWGFRPGAAGNNKTDRHATMAHVKLGDNRLVTFERAMNLDLGGIAKGFAVDQAAQILSSYPGLSGIVNAGGDLRAFGAEGHRVAIRNPGQPGQLALQLTLKKQSMATSGTYFSRKRWRGRSITHLARNSVRVSPVSSTSSISVLSSSCMTADALTKAGFTLPRQKFCRLLTQYDSAAIVVHTDGTHEEVA